MNSYYTLVKSTRFYSSFFIVRSFDLLIASMLHLMIYRKRIDIFQIKPDRYHISEFPQHNHKIIIHATNVHKSRQNTERWKTDLTFYRYIQLHEYANINMTLWKHEAGKHRDSSNISLLQIS